MNKYKLFISFLAVSCEHKDIVELLLSHKADISLCDNEGLTPLLLDTSSDIKQLFNDLKCS